MTVAGRAAANGAAASAGGLRAATALGALRTGMNGPLAAPLNAAVGLGAAAAGGLRTSADRIAGHFRDREHAGARTVTGAAGAVTPQPSAASIPTAASGQPAWAKRFRHNQMMREGAMIAAHTMTAGDGGGASEGPTLKQRD
jgi:type IV secretion system protein TrbL